MAAGPYGVTETGAVYAAVHALAELSRTCAIDVTVHHGHIDITTVGGPGVLKAWVEGYSGGIALTHVDPVKRAISGADIKPGMTILLTPGSKPFRVDGVEPFNKSDSTFTLSSGPPHSWTGQLVYADRWYCLLGGVE